MVIVGAAWLLLPLSVIIQGCHIRLSFNGLIKYIELKMYIFSSLKKKKKKKSMLKCANFWDGEYQPSLQRSFK